MAPAIKMGWGRLSLRSKLMSARSHVMARWKHFACRGVSRVPPRRGEHIVWVVVAEGVPTPVQHSRAEDAAPLRGRVAAEGVVAHRRRTGAREAAAMRAGRVRDEAAVADRRSS